MMNDDIISTLYVDQILLNKTTLTNYFAKQWHLLQGKGLIRPQVLSYTISSTKKKK
jgi:hypothetical protein